MDTITLNKDVYTTASGWNELTGKQLLKVADMMNDVTNLNEFLIKLWLEMLDFKVDWESTDQGEGVKWKGFAMLSEVWIELEHGQNWVRWAFPPTIQKMILEPERFSKLNLKIITSISTYQGTALYDICSRYRDNPSGVTSRKSVDWWIDALSQSASALGKKREWRKFKLEKLAGAIEEINQDSDIAIELIEYKTGRAITEAQFSVKKKNIVSPVGKLGPIDDKKLCEIEKRSHSLGISLSRMEKLIRKHGEDLVITKLNQLDQRLLDKSREKIEDKYAYLRTILTNYESAQEAKVLTQELAKEKVVDNPNETLNLASILGFSKVNKNIQEFSNLPTLSTDPTAVVKQISNTRDEINSLSEDERIYWIDKGIKSLRARNLITPRDLKQAEVGMVVSGQLGGEIVRIYSNEKHA